MAEPQKWVYWVIKCKTEGCNTVILLSSVGRSVRYRDYLLSHCTDFQEECPECHSVHRYSILDVDTRERPDNPATFRPSQAFLSAAKRKQEHYDASDVEDGDSEVKRSAQGD